jgi:hypothetical protein
MAEFIQLRIKTENFTASDSVLFDYLNELGRGKARILVKALKAFFYPEIAYEKKLLDCDVDEINQALCMLEARLNYLKQLTGSKVKPTTNVSLSQASLSVSSSINSTCKYGDDDSVEITQSNSDPDELDDSQLDYFNDGL